MVRPLMFTPWRHPPSSTVVAWVSESVVSEWGQRVWSVVSQRVWSVSRVLQLPTAVASLFFCLFLLKTSIGTVAAGACAAVVDFTWIGNGIENAGHVGYFGKDERRKRLWNSASSRFPPFSLVSRLRATLGQYKRPVPHILALEVLPRCEPNWFNG